MFGIYHRESMQPMLRHSLRSNLHQIIRSHRNRIPRHNILHSLPQNPPRRFRILQLAQRDQATALLPREEIERAHEPHETTVHPIGILGVLEAFDDRGSGHSCLEEGGDGFVYGGVRGECEEVGLGCHEVGDDAVCGFGGGGYEYSLLLLLLIGDREGEAVPDCLEEQKEC